MGNEESTLGGARRWPAVTPGQVAAKTIQNPTDWGYTVTKAPDRDNWVIMHPTVATLRGAPVVLVIVELKARDQVEIPWAYTHHDKRPKEEKLALRDLILGVWSFHANREADVASMKSIKYTNVEEKGLVDTWAPQVYQLMSVTPKTSLEVRRFGARPGEAEAYELLQANSVFCIGARNMLREYAALNGLPPFGDRIRICKSFEFEWQANGFNFVIHF